MTLERISEVIQSGSNFAILPHVRADGDCIGSSFALLLALRKLGKSAKVILEEDIPQIYSFLPGDYIKFEDLPANTKFEITICLDSGDEERINRRMKLVNESKTSINIDHHITNTKYAQYNYIDTYSSATGEIVYEAIKQLGAEIDEEIATNLYVAIATDTGGFRYGNTTSKTHSIAAKLLQANIDIAKINRKIFETVTLAKLKLISMVANRLELHANGKIAVIAISRELILEAGANEDDVDGLSSLPRTIEGVEVGVLLTEKGHGNTKVSFRSNEYIDVSKVAAFFNGGGHKRASGCTLETDIETAKEKILAVVKEIMQVEKE